MPRIGDHRPVFVHRAHSTGPSAPATGPAGPTDSMDRSGRPSAAALVRPPVGPTGNEKVIAPGVWLDAGGGLVVDRRPMLRPTGVTSGSARVVYDAAQRLADAQDPFAKLSRKEKTTLAEHLNGFVRYHSQFRGRPSRLSVRARAGAFSLLVRLAEGLRTPAEKPLLRRVLDGLFDAVEAEPDAGLRGHMGQSLLALPSSRLLRGEKARRKAALETVAPSHPPYPSWFGDDPAPQLNVRQYVQDEFWKREISNYKKDGYTISVDGKRAVAEKTVTDPSGKHPPTVLRVELFEADQNVFRDAHNDDIHVVLYTGHAQVGAVAKWSEDMAKGQKGDKLIGLFACRTKQSMAGVKRAFPDAHVLCSDDGTYGHDDRIAITTLLDGIAKRQDYATIRDRTEAHDLWEKDNYFLPDDVRQLAHYDIDGDGKVAMAGGRPDMVYDVDITHPPGTRITMTPRRKVPDLATLAGHNVTEAVSWFNTVHFYWTETFGFDGELAMADRFRSDGWFHSDDPDEIVRLEEVKVRGQDPIYKVQVNAAYSHQSEEALAMMVTYALAQQLQRASRPDDDDHTRRMRSLAMVSSYVANLVQYGDDATQLLQRFAKRFGFPPTLTWPVVETAINADHDHEASPKIVKLLERGMQYPFLEVNPTRTTTAFRVRVQKALDLLRNSDVPAARTTFDAIVSGRVLVDTLQDLSRADFHRLRREYARVGTDFAADEYLDLHDKRTRIYRALTGDIDGYMWDNRVYLAEGRDGKDLAATLIHEVNHIINESEEHYRSEAAILREEYRAYYAEELFRGTKDLTDPEVCRKLKQQVIDLYELKTVSVDDVPDLPPGMFDFADDHHHADHHV